VKITALQVAMVKTTKKFTNEKKRKNNGRTLALKCMPCFSQILDGFKVCTTQTRSRLESYPTNKVKI
jgi:hypothetical protein